MFVVVSGLSDLSSPSEEFMGTSGTSDYHTSEEDVPEIVMDGDEDNKKSGLEFLGAGLGKKEIPGGKRQRRWFDGSSVWGSDEPDPDRCSSTQPVTSREKFESHSYSTCVFVFLGE